MPTLTQQVLDDFNTKRKATKPQNSDYKETLEQLYNEMKGYLIQDDSSTLQSELKTMITHNIADQRRYEYSKKGDPTLGDILVDSYRSTYRCVQMLERPDGKKESFSPDQWSYLQMFISDPPIWTSKAKKTLTPDEWIKYDIYKNSFLTQQPIPQIEPLPTATNTTIHSPQNMQTPQSQNVTTITLTNSTVPVQQPSPSALTPINTQTASLTTTPEPSINALITYLNNHKPATIEFTGIKRNPTNDGVTLSTKTTRLASAQGIVLPDINLADNGIISSTVPRHKDQINVFAEALVAAHIASLKCNGQPFTRMSIPEIECNNQSMKDALSAAFESAVKADLNITLTAPPLLTPQPDSSRHNMTSLVAHQSDIDMNENKDEEETAESALSRAKGH